LPKPNDVLANGMQRLDSVTMRLPRSLHANVQRHAIALTKTGSRLSSGMVTERLTQMRRRLPELNARRLRAVAQFIAKKSDALVSEWKVLRTVSYQATLERGFAIVRDQKGKTLQRASEANSMNYVDIRFVDGDVPATIGKIPKQGSLF
jgi:exodeoxyribonuclease VII large subunit